MNYEHIFLPKVSSQQISAKNSGGKNKNGHEKFPKNLPLGATYEYNYEKLGSKLSVANCQRFARNRSAWNDF